MVSTKKTTDLGVIENTPTNSLVPLSEQTQAPTTPQGARGLQFSSDASSIDPEDLTPLLLRLAQSTTPEVQEGKATMGKYLITGYAPSDELIVIPLMQAKDHKLTDSEGKTLCRSTDCIVGYGEPGGLCAKCPLIQWVDGNKPKCNLRYNFIFYSPIHNMPIRFIMQKSGIKTARTILTMMLAQGAGNFAIKLGSSVGGKPRYASTTVEYVDIDPEILQAAKRFMPKGAIIEDDEILTEE